MILRIKTMLRQCVRAAPAAGAALLVILCGTFFSGIAFPERAGIVPLSREAAPPPPSRPPRPGSGPAKGKLLVASRNLGDPRFRETAVLLISADTRGAMGLIINRPTKVTLADVFPGDPAFEKKAVTVYFGGPVAVDTMLLLMRSPGRPDESAPVFDNVSVSSSRTVLDRMINRQKPGESVRVYAGYCGWAAGQLEGELMRGDWVVMSATETLIFDKKSEAIWPELIRRGPELQVRRPKGAPQRAGGA